MYRYLIIGSLARVYPIYVGPRNPRPRTITGRAALSMAGVYAQYQI